MLDQSNDASQTPSKAMKRMFAFIIYTYLFEVHAKIRSQRKYT